MIDDFSEITLDECRAVLCVHMLCYVLDGSIGFSELELWKRMTERVEELYQIGARSSPSPSGPPLDRHVAPPPLVLLS